MWFRFSRECLYSSSPAPNGLRRRFQEDGNIEVPPVLARPKEGMSSKASATKPQESCYNFAMQYSTHWT